MYWQSSPGEVRRLQQAYTELREQHDRNAALRAGLIAAVIVNTRPGRKRGSRTYYPEDFVSGTGSQAPLSDDDITRLERLASGEVLMRPD